MPAPATSNMDQQMVDDASEQPISNAAGSAIPSENGWREGHLGKVVVVSGLSKNTFTNGDIRTDTGDKAERPARYRPRTFPYQQYLPYAHDDKKYENLEECIRRVYIAVSAGDFIPGATHWTRELRGWIQLKFDLPRQDRVRLAKLYYELALAPGMEHAASERFAGMFMSLTKYAFHRSLR